LLLPAAVAGADRVDLDAAAAVALEGDPLPVRRVGRMLVADEVAGQAGGGSAAGLHPPDLGAVVALGDEGDEVAIRRPSRLPVGGRVGGQRHLAGAVGVHHVDVGVAVAVGREGDAGAVRRQGRLAVVRPRRVGDVGDAGAVRVHGIDLPVPAGIGGKGDLAGRGGRADVERDRAFGVGRAAVLHAPDEPGRAGEARRRRVVDLERVGAVGRQRALRRRGDDSHGGVGRHAVAGLERDREVDRIHRHADGLADRLQRAGAHRDAHDAHIGLAAAVAGQVGERVVAQEAGVGPVFDALGVQHDEPPVGRIAVDQEAVGRDAVDGGKRDLNRRLVGRGQVEVGGAEGQRVEAAADSGQSGGRQGVGCGSGGGGVQRVDITVGDGDRLRLGGRPLAPVVGHRQPVGDLPRLLEGAKLGGVQVALLVGHEDDLALPGVVDVVQAQRVQPHAGLDVGRDRGRRRHAARIARRDQARHIRRDGHHHRRRLILRRGEGRRRGGRERIGGGRRVGGRVGQAGGICDGWRVRSDDDIRRPGRRRRQRQRGDHGDGRRDDRCGRRRHGRVRDGGAGQDGHARDIRDGGGRRLAGRQRQQHTEQRHHRPAHLHLTHKNRRRRPPALAGGGMRHASFLTKVQLC